MRRTVSAETTGLIATLAVSGVLIVCCAPALAQDCTPGIDCIVTEAESESAKLDVVGWDATLNFGRYPALHGTLSASDELCIASKDGLFTATFRSAQSSGGFAFRGGGFTSLPYHVSFSSAGTSVHDLNPDTPYLFPTDVKKCKGTDTGALLQIDIHAAEFNAAESGLYADVLYVVFSVP